jgi:hypothetical protein
VFTRGLPSLFLEKRHPHLSPHNPGDTGQTKWLGKFDWSFFAMNGGLYEAEMQVFCRDLYIFGGLGLEHFYFSIYWEFHHPN